MLREAILQYIDHLQDAEYLSSLFASTGHEKLVVALTELLRSDDHEEVSLACLFIRDVMLMAPRTEQILQFRESYETSSLITELERLVEDGNFFSSRQAVYTLGKTGAERSLPVLIRALDTLNERDPLILPPLLFEIWWLQPEKDWSLVEPLLSSTRFMTRWAALEAIQKWHSRSELQHERKRHFEQMRHDENEWIRAEAEFLYQELLLEERLPNLNGKPERRRQRKEIELLRPNLSFMIVAVQFSNHLHRKNTVFYRVEELEEFVAALANEAH